MTPAAELLVALLDRLRPDASLPQLLCEEAVVRLPVTGASVAVMRDARTPTMIASSDGPTGDVAVLQLSLGEGPGVEAFLGRSAVCRPDLQADADRWPAFAPAATEAGVRAIFSLPLLVGGVPLGVLDLHRSTPGGLDDLTTARHVAEAAVAVALHLEGRPHDEREVAAALDEWHEAEPEVALAAGMVAAQAEVSPTEALLLMRARASEGGLSMASMARDVVAKTLRFD